MSAVGPPIDATPVRRLVSLSVVLGITTLVAALLGFPLPMDLSGWLPVIAVAVVGLLLWAFVLPRIVKPFGARLAILAVVGLVAGWYLVSPVFRSTVVDEALPMTAEDVDGDGAPASADDPGPAEATDAAAPVTTEPSAGGGPSEPPPAAQPAPPAQPTRVAGGSFTGIGHRAMGGVGLYELADGTFVVRLEDVEFQNGPDLFVYLVPEPGQSDDGGAVNLGRLKGNIGSSNYMVPAGVDQSAYATVLIWCRAFSTPFANATLES